LDALIATAGHKSSKYFFSGIVIKATTEVMSDGDKKVKEKHKL